MCKEDIRLFSDSVRCVAVVGAQWGDEGKGKLIDVLAENATIVARYQGGANAGHTVQVGGEQFILHLIPSGALYPEVRCLLGNGVVIDPWTLLEEIEALERRGIDLDGRLGLSRRAHLVLPYHLLLDRAHEASRGSGKLGTTGRGIGPAYRDKVARVGLRVGDLASRDRVAEVVKAGSAAANSVLERIGSEERADADEIVEALAEISGALVGLGAECGDEIREALGGGGRVLLEGAQGALLDVDHGTYPYVTSSTTTAGGAASGVGIGPTVIDGVLGIVKAYTTRVGEGPLPTELEGEEAQHLRTLGAEFGATTGRPRRPGWFDAMVVRYAAGVNGLTALAITKLDVLDTFEELKLGVGYELDGARAGHFPESSDALERVRPVYESMTGWTTPTTAASSWDELASGARDYLTRIEELSGVPIRYVSVGAGRSETIEIPEGGVASTGAGD
jgi:adenylosuccinate synthase